MLQSSDQRIRWTGDGGHREGNMAGRESGRFQEPDALNFGAAQIEFENIVSVNQPTRLAPVGIEQLQKLFRHGGIECASARNQFRFVRKTAQAQPGPRFRRREIKAGIPRDIGTMISQIPVKQLFAAYPILSEANVLANRS